MSQNSFILSAFMFLYSTYSLCADIQQYQINRHASLKQYDNQKQMQYKEYKLKHNAEFAEFMQKSWTEFKSFAAMKKPKSTEPPVPAVKTNEAPAPKQEIRYKVVITLVPYEVPDPVEPIVEDTPADDDTQPIFRFIFHNTPCSVHFSNAQAYVAPDASEQSAASGWEVLSAGDYDITVNDCIKLRDDLQLGDWGYIKMLQALTSTYCTGHNEAVLMQMYILTQSGYMVRIARTGNKWVLLMPCENDIYGYSYIYRDNMKYYILDSVDSSGSYYVFDKAFPNEQQLSLLLPKAPKLAYAPTAERTLTSNRYPNIRVTIAENKNLIEFYNEYPLSSKWDYYSQTSLSDKAKESLYPILRSQISGVSTKSAANMLINFVQTAFDYKTDQEQFGYERPLFGDETLFYPYSDCEDRSILYSILVRDLLGLEVVLLEFPGHLATAVRFPNDEVHGYYINIDGKKYTICDPTYINAEIGDCMPQYQKSELNVIKI